MNDDLATIDGELLTPPQHGKQPDAIEYGKGPFSPDERRAVLALIHDGHSLRAVANRTGRNVSTISRLARSAGISPDRVAQTAPGLIAAEFRLKERRAALANALMSDAERLRERLWAPSITTRVNGRTGETVKLRHKYPTPTETRDLVIALGILSDKVIALTRDVAPEDGKAAIIALVDNLRLNVGREDTDTR